MTLHNLLVMMLSFNLFITVFHNIHFGTVPILWSIVDFIVLIGLTSLAFKSKKEQ